VFLQLTEIEEGAVKILLNADQIQQVRPFVGVSGTFREVAKTEITLVNGTRLLVRETPAALKAALSAVVPS
jgi:uncharacterized protein YlzI (FlbEa/FlbD family)